MFNKYLTKSGRISTKQPQQIKTQWYIQRAQEVHGTKYLYNRFEFNGSTTKSIITCRVHGDFTQTPNNHISNKQGCPTCQGKTLGLEEFLLRANQAHGDTYDYSASVFKGMKSKINIVCRTHGEFYQQAYDHVCGHGCAKCAGVYNLDREQVVEQFVKTHGDKYDYSQVVYAGDQVKVRILCKKHGPFYQNPGHHKRGHGCPCCQDRHNQDTVYLLRDTQSNLVKIGITNNLARRVKEIGLTLEVLAVATVKQPRILEQSLHNEFSQFRKPNLQQASGSSEFFSLSQEQIENLINRLKEEEE